MDGPLRVLLATRSDPLSNHVVKVLRQGGGAVSIRCIETLGALAACLGEESPDVVLLDDALPCCRDYESVDLVRSRDADRPVIVLSDALDEDRVVTALRHGAADYVLKSSLARLWPAVERALQESQERAAQRRAEDAEHEEEERYRELVENANDAVLTVDLGGNFTSTSRAGELISGYRREELRHMNIAQVLTPQSFQLALQMIQQKLVDDKPTTYELEMIARDGHHVSLEVSSRLIYHDGAPTGIHCIARDITERKKAAQALRESEERYRGLFENSSDIVYTHDFEGNFTSVNDASRRVTGYAPEEILRMNIAGIIAPDHLERAQNMIRRKLEASIPTTYELDIITKDGRRVTIEVNSQLIYHEGTPARVQGIARDITERRRAEEELRARERKQASVARLGQQALASSNLDALLEEAVRCVTETLELPYCTVLELVQNGAALFARAGIGWKKGLMGHVTVGAGPRSQAGFALLAGEPVIMEDLHEESRFWVPTVLTDHDITSGMSVIIEGRSHPFGTLNAFSGAHRSFSQDDVHFLQAVANVLGTAIERTRLEEERAQHSKELTTRVLQAQEEERKRIARELHDETAQSLAVLLANLDLLEQRLPDDGQLRSGFERIGELAHRALDETRALSHDLRPTILDDVGLVAALEWLADDYEQTHGAAVRVRTRSERTEGLAAEVEVALFRIAQEALTNSGKHAGATNLDLELSVSPATARLTIRDDGCGFDPSNVPGATREGRLGLYGMHERAMLLGGTLQIVTAAGQGTSICVEIPLPADEKDTPEEIE